MIAADAVARFSYLRLYAIDSYPRFDEDTELLGRVEQLLRDASQAYLQHRYQDAIRAYFAAEALIHAHMTPGFRPGDVPVRDAAGFDPLLRASTEWLNLIGVQTPPLVGPPIGPDPGPMERVTGLSIPSLSTANDWSAVTDLRRAAILTAQGNIAAADVVTARAAQTSPGVAAVLGPLLIPVAPNVETQNLVFQEPVEASADLGSLLTPLAPNIEAQAMAFEEPQPAEASARKVAGGLVDWLSRWIKPPVSPPIERALTSVETVIEQEQLKATVAKRARLDTLPAAMTGTRMLGMVVGQGPDARVETVAWRTGFLPDTTRVRDLVYSVRASDAFLSPWLTSPQTPADAALALPHDYYFVIPLGLAECYHAIGDWQKAQKYYVAAASYQYINKTLEAPFVWVRLATMYVDWGNSLYQQDDPGAALAAYQNVLQIDDTIPAASPLYATAGIAPGRALAEQVVARIPDIVANPAGAAALGLDPAVAGPMLEARQRLAQIDAGLDFWGNWAPSVPIWTFEYLQQVAINYCQLAMSTERDVINFWDRADQAALTRAELSQRMTDSSLEATAANLQWTASKAEADAYAKGATLAATRAANAADNRTDYQNLHGQAIVMQAQSTQVSGGQDGNVGQLNALADQLMSGHGIRDKRSTVAGAVQLVAARLDQQYELGAMQRTIGELNQAADQANAELAAANARSTVAMMGFALASVRAVEAQQMLALFDDATFTPQIWHRMGDAMFRLYRRYLDMALRTARMMQRAYNFENDTHLALIRPSYASDEIRGLLGADMLMADIQSFTDQTLTTTRTKTQLVKQTISLSERHSYLFETQFRSTGTMAFDTTFDDFEMSYPGTYGGRIRAVEVAVQGLVPATGVSGTLTNGGVSRYRLPSDSWTETDSVRYRIQSAETLVLSDYNRRSDLLDSADTRKLGIFAGAGVVSSWHLDLPPAVNDLDYALVTDVQLTFTYEARFDPALVGRVKNLIATQPGAHDSQRGIPLRWLYPDLFFRFQDTGTFTLNLVSADFPLNERLPVLTSVGLLAVPGAPSSGLVVDIATPGRAAVKGTAGADGSVSSATAASPLVALTAGTALGDYTITVNAADNPTWIADGKLDLGRIGNLVLIIGYSYTPRA
jgi:tetratricopeptide (TPR) repeat protein